MEPNHKRYEEGHQPLKDKGIVQRLVENWFTCVLLPQTLPIPWISWTNLCMQIDWLILKQLRRFQGILNHLYVRDWPLAIMAIWKWALYRCWLARFSHINIWHLIIVQLSQITLWHRGERRKILLLGLVQRLNTKLWLMEPMNHYSWRFCYENMVFQWKDLWVYSLYHSVFFFLFKR